MSDNSAQEVEEGFTEVVASVEPRRIFGRLKNRRRCWHRGSSGV